MAQDSADTYLRRIAESMNLGDTLAFQWILTPGCQSVAAQSDLLSIRWNLCNSDTTFIDRQVASRKRTFVRAEG